MDISSFKYLPFSRGRGQQIHEAAAMDGALVVVELPAAAFVWGARTFSQVRLPNPIFTAVPTRMPFSGTKKTGCYRLGLYKIRC